MKIGAVAHTIAGVTDSVVIVVISVTDAATVIVRLRVKAQQQAILSLMQHLQPRIMATLITAKRPLHPPLSRRRASKVETQQRHPWRC